jgi:hypothetical protein
MRGQGVSSSHLPAHSPTREEMAATATAALHFAAVTNGIHLSRAGRARARVTEQHTAMPTTCVTRSHQRISRFSSVPGSAQKMKQSGLMHGKARQITPVRRNRGHKWAHLTAAHAYKAHRRSAVPSRHQTLAQPICHRSTRRCAGPPQDHSHVDTLGSPKQWAQSAIDRGICGRGKSVDYLLRVPQIKTNNRVRRSLWVWLCACSGNSAPHTHQANRKYDGSQSLLLFQSRTGR